MRIKDFGTMPVPPGFGHDKDWEMRLVGWYERNNENPKEPQHVTAMVFRGMAVDEGLHEYYWEAYANFEKAVAVWAKSGKPMDRAFFLTNENKQVVGAGMFEPSDGPHEMTWLGCMFAEMRGWRTSMYLPAGTTIEEMGDAPLGTLVETGRA